MELSDYSDYRALLKDLYEERKRKDPKFSYRFIALHAGFKSAAFFSHILTGKSDISLRTALSLAEVFKLKGSDLEYFENLVHFNQSETKADKQHFFKRIAAQKRGKAKTLEAGQYGLFAKWYYLPVRELISLTDFKGDFKELAGLVVPKITVTEAREAVKVLERLSMVLRHPDRYERLDAAITTGRKWKSSAIMHYQMEALDLAKASYHNVPAGDRSHSTLTLTLSASEFQSLREDISALRGKLLELSSNSAAPERVYQATFSVFAVSKAYRV